MEALETKCCVHGCEEVAKFTHMSLVGQIPFPVCKKHYNETEPYWSFESDMFRHSQMGLIDKETNKIIELY